MVAAFKTETWQQNPENDPDQEDAATDHEPGLLLVLIERIFCSGGRLKFPFEGNHA